MTQDWNDILTQNEEQEQLAETLPRVRVVTGTPAATVLDARLADVLGGQDWATTTDDQLIGLAEMYMVETLPQYTETGFLGRVKVYRPPEDQGNIVIGPVAEFGRLDPRDVPVSDEPMSQKEALETIKRISENLKEIAHPEDDDSASSGK